jgi:hypothetical protein
LLQLLAHGAAELILVDPAVEVGDLLRTADLEPLALLDGLDELTGLHQGLVGAGIEPGGAAADAAQVQLAALEIAVVEVGDLQLAARRGRRDSASSQTLPS